MEKINEIFYKGLPFEQENIIKTIDIDPEGHKQGILNLAKSLEPDFELNEDNKNILNLLFFYFTGNGTSFNSKMQEYLKIKGSLNKGIMLIGDVGTGKSLLFEIFKLYTGKILRVNSFQYHYSSEIIDSVNVNGIEYLDLFNRNFNNPITCYIDDIASKNEEIKHYGTLYNVIEQLLSIRYNIYSRYRKLTHLSTNKYPAELKKIYDDRIIDRMREMFNIIELKGSSFRR